MVYSNLKPASLELGVTWDFLEWVRDGFIPPFTLPKNQYLKKQVKLGHEFHLGDKKYWAFSYKKKFLSYTGIWRTWIICLSMYKADWNINITEVNYRKKTKILKRYCNFKMIGIGSHFVFRCVTLSKYE